MKKKFNTAVVKYNIKMDGFPTSITLRRDVVSLWILLTENYTLDKTLLVREFIEDKVLPRWTRSHGRGLSEFISKCMIRSILSSDDYSMYRKIEREL